MDELLSAPWKGTGLRSSLKRTGPMTFRKSYLVQVLSHR